MSIFDELISEKSDENILSTSFNLNSNIPLINKPIDEKNKSIDSIKLQIFGYDRRKTFNQEELNYNNRIISEILEVKDSSKNVKIEKNKDLNKNQRFKKKSEISKNNLNRTRKAEFIYNSKKIKENNKKRNNKKSNILKMNPELPLKPNISTLGIILDSEPLKLIDSKNSVIQYVKKINIENYSSLDLTQRIKNQYFNSLENPEALSSNCNDKIFLMSKEPISNISNVKRVTGYHDPQKKLINHSKFVDEKFLVNKMINKLNSKTSLITTKNTLLKKENFNLKPHNNKFSNNKNLLRTAGCKKHDTEYVSKSTSKSMLDLQNSKKFKAKDIIYTKLSNPMHKKSNLISSNRPSTLSKLELYDRTKS